MDLHGFLWGFGQNYGSDFEVRVPVYITARVVGKSSQSFYPVVCFQDLPKVLFEVVL